MTPKGSYYFEVSNRATTSRYHRDERSPQHRRRRERSAGRSETALPRSAGGVVAGDSVWLDMRSGEELLQRKRDRSRRRSDDERRERERRRHHRSRSPRNARERSPRDLRNNKEEKHRARKLPEMTAEAANESDSDSSISDTDTDSMLRLSCSDYDIDLEPIVDDDDVSRSRSPPQSSASQRVRSVLVRPELKDAESGSEEMTSREAQRESGKVKESVKTALIKEEASSANGAPKRLRSVNNSKDNDASDCANVATVDAQKSTSASKRRVIKPLMSLAPSTPPPRKRYSPIIWSEPKNSDRDSRAASCERRNHKHSRSSSDSRRLSSQGRRF